MMTERIGVAKQTYQRVERGDPTVAIGIYAMAIFVLGLGDTPFDIADSSRDKQGKLNHSNCISPVGTGRVDGTGDSSNCKCWAFTA